MTKIIKQMWINLKNHLTKQVYLYFTNSYVIHNITYSSSLYQSIVILDSNESRSKLYSAQLRNFKA